jgi:hypothetical protein
VLSAQYLQLLCVGDLNPLSLMVMLTAQLLQLAPQPLQLIRVSDLHPLVMQLGCSLQARDLLFVLESQFGESML